MLEAEAEVAMPMSNFKSTTFSEEATPTPNTTLSTFNPFSLPNTNLIIKPKKKRSLPGNPDPDAEVIALSPKSLLARNRFVCEICKKGFQRDQNLQLHRRGHNLPWKLKQRNKDEVIRKKAYVCPESTCVHHHPSRALGDLTGIKKHFSRKHGEKKYKCDKCSKIYAVQSDWKAHSKTCGTREYRCDCGTLFSRRDSFITHRAFCDALAEESVRLSTTTNPFSNPTLILPPPPPFSSSTQNPNSHLFPNFSSPWAPPPPQNPNNPNPNYNQIKTENNNHHFFSPPYTFQQPPFTTAPFLSATALLQKATTMGAGMGPQPTTHDDHDDDQAALMEAMMGGGAPHSLESLASAAWQRNNDGFTRDFLGLAAGDDFDQRGGVDPEEDMNHMIKFTGGLQYSMTSHYDGDNSSSSSSILLLKPDHHHHHHNQQQVDDHDHDQGFGAFVTSSMEMDSRWG